MEESEIACVCRNIYVDDFPSEEELIARLKDPDARCRQCLLRYEDPYELCSLEDALEFDRKRNYTYTDPYDSWKPSKDISWI